MGMATQVQREEVNRVEAKAGEEGIILFKNCKPGAAQIRVSPLRFTPIFSCYLKPPEGV
jgi:hypothetical protein